MFSKMPFILVGLILGIIFLDSNIPILIKEILYTLSINIKSLIIFILPFIIFGLLFNAIIRLASSATKIIGLILVLVCCSNFISTFLSRYVGMLIYNIDLSLIIHSSTDALKPLWEIKLNKLLDNDLAMFSAVIIGLISNIIFRDTAIKFSILIDKIINYILKTFTIIIPIFIVGFIIKIQYDGVAKLIFQEYTVIFTIIALAQYSYILFLYFAMSSFKFNNFISNIRNMLPAAIAAFSSMSSAAAMPLTIVGVEKNTKNKEVVKSIVPVTVNIHLIGDCFAIPIFAYAIMKSFGIVAPDFYTYMVFIFYFILAKFSVAAVPGGGVLVMLPILESKLGFDGAMLSLITALYILFDPIITCANTLGNGVFAKVIDIAINKFFIKNHKL